MHLSLEQNIPPKKNPQLTPSPQSTLLQHLCDVHNDSPETAVFVSCLLADL